MPQPYASPMSLLVATQITAIEALNNIADMVRGTAHPAQARPYYQKALQIATSIAAQLEQARALGLCGEALVLPVWRIRGHKHVHIVASRIS